MIDAQPQGISFQILFHYLAIFSEIKFFIILLINLASSKHYVLIKQDIIVLKPNIVKDDQISSSIIETNFDNFLYPQRIKKEMTESVITFKLPKSVLNGLSEEKREITLIILKQDINALNLQLLLYLGLKLMKIVLLIQQA